MTRGGVVFVVDDDASLARALCRLVRAAGLDAQAFSSARAFLDAPPPTRPACLVLDVRLPGLSGPQLQDALRGAGREIPIVFITGHADVATSVKAMKGGAVDFLEKPFDDRVLLDTVERALERDRGARAERAERDAIQQRIASLTPRERQVLALVVSGRLNKQIGGELGAAEKTIKVHRGRVMRKMRAASLVDLVRMAEKVGLTLPGGAAATEA